MDKLLALQTFGGQDRTYRDALERMWARDDKIGCAIVGACAGFFIGSALDVIVPALYHQSAGKLLAVVQALS